MTTTPSLCLQVQGLRKAYGSRQAVAEVQFTLQRGEVLGLLGPNGAGKSTTVGMICGLTPPDAGEVMLDGGLTLSNDATAFKRRIGLVPQDLALYEELPARTNLALFGALYGLSAAQIGERSARLLRMVGLEDRAGDRPSTFSGGMKRRLNIACALMHDPDIVILDEPTAGVDPQSRNAIFDNLELLKAEGKALIYTTHYMEEAERLADRIVIIDHGRVVASGSQAELYAAHAAKPTLQVEFDEEPAAEQVAGLPGHERRSSRLFDFPLRSLDGDPAQLLTRLGQLGLQIRHVATAKATLEDVFLALTGRQLRD